VPPRTFTAPTRVGAPPWNRVLTPPKELGCSPLFVFLFLGGLFFWTCTQNPFQKDYVFFRKGEPQARLFRVSWDFGEVWTYTVGKRNFYPPLFQIIFR